MFAAQMEETIVSKSGTKRVSLPELPGEVIALAEIGSFTGTQKLATAGRIMMAQHVRQLHAHLPGAISGDDPHDIHQMRVATRRLRACLEATAPVYDRDIVTGLRKRLRKLAQALGAVRDQDVLLMRLVSDAEARRNNEDTKLHTALEQIENQAEQNEFDQVIERVSTERNEAHAALIDALGRKRNARLLQDLNEFMISSEDDEAASDELPLLVRHFAGSAIWQQYEAVQRFESIITFASSEQLHELRIACKHLRYTLELFEPALGKEAADVIKRVKAMQEHLGNLHDTDVALTFFGIDVQTVSDQPSTNTEVTDGQADSSTTEPAVHPTTNRYVEDKLAERQTLLAGVQPLWQQLTGDTTRRKLARMIAFL